jgi:hypothetical protein
MSELHLMQFVITIETYLNEQIQEPVVVYFKHDTESVSSINLTEFLVSQILRRFVLSEVSLQTSFKIILIFERAFLTPVQNSLQ